MRNFKFKLTRQLLDVLLDDLNINIYLYYVWRMSNWQFHHYTNQIYFFLIRSWLLKIKRNLNRACLSCRETKEGTVCRWTTGGRRFSKRGSTVRCPEKFPSISMKSVRAKQWETLFLFLRTHSVHNNNKLIYFAFQVILRVRQIKADISLNRNLDCDV